MTGAISVCTKNLEATWLRSTGALMVPLGAKVAAASGGMPIWFVAELARSLNIDATTLGGLQLLYVRGSAHADMPETS